MKRNHFFEGLLCVAITIFFISCNQNKTTSGGTGVNAASAISKADSLWSTASATVDGHMSYFLEDAVILAPNEPLLSGKDAIRKMQDGLYAIPGFSIKWQANKVEVGSSGDLGYSRGNYELTMNDESGNLITDKGKYLTVWKKQSDGSWKVSADMFNSDMPLSINVEK